MDDRTIVKIFYTHIFRIFIIAVIAFVSSLGDTHAATGGEKNSKKNRETDKKVGGSDTKAIPIDIKATITSSNESVSKMPTYYRPIHIDQKVNLSGEDQNAVLSFNLIHYIFQRFKFSEEVY